MNFLPLKVASWTICPVPRQLQCILTMTSNDNLKAKQRHLKQFHAVAKEFKLRTKCSWNWTFVTSWFLYGRIAQRLFVSDFVAPGTSWIVVLGHVSFSHIHRNCPKSIIFMKHDGGKVAGNTSSPVSLGKLGSKLLIIIAINDCRGWGFFVVSGTRCYIAAVTERWIRDNHWKYF